MFYIHNCKKTNATPGNSTHCPAFSRRIQPFSAEPRRSLNHFHALFHKIGPKIKYPKKQVFYFFSAPHTFRELFWQNFSALYKFTESTILGRGRLLG
jgi:hypothetical protein